MLQQNIAPQVIQALRHVLPNGQAVQIAIQALKNVLHVQADTMQTEQAAQAVQMYQQDVPPAQIQLHVQHVMPDITKIHQINVRHVHQPNTALREHPALQMLVLLPLPVALVVQEQAAPDVLRGII